jgi:hypothetical protein
VEVEVVVAEIQILLLINIMAITVIKVVGEVLAVLL